MTTVEHDLEPATRRHVTLLTEELDRSRLGAEMAERICASIPDLADVDDDDFRVVLTESCTSNVAAILDGLVEGRSPDDASPPPNATAWAHELVHRRMPLATLLRAYRLGHWVLQQRCEDASRVLDVDADLRLRVLARASSHMFAYLDVVCAQLVEDYEAEREQWVRGAAAAQTALVQRILAGERVDPGEAEVTLRYPVEAAQIGYLVWRDPSVGRDDLAPAAVARRLGRHLGGFQTLVLPIGEHAAWAWATGPALVPPPRGAHEDLDPLLSAAVGDVHTGVAGMRRSHREAQAARRVAEIVGQRPGAVEPFAATALNALLLTDLVSPSEFAARELGDLAVDTDAALRLRATLTVYLAENCRRASTARRLGIHENTVKYRLNRCEELLGWPIAERRLELEVALRLFDAAGGAGGGAPGG